ncbi:MAG: hypothetical protein AAF399_27655 [Bacteroidota bacterium]
MAPVPVEIAEKASCHLTGDAKVELRMAGFDSESPFYYLVLLDEEGKGLQDVYAGVLSKELQHIDTKVQLVYHESYLGKHSYTSACGPDGDGNPVTEYMRAIVACDISLAPS